MRKNRLKIYITSLILLTSLKSCMNAKSILDKDEITYNKTNIEYQEPLPTPVPSIEPVIVYKDAYLINDDIVYDKYMNKICDISAYQKVKRRDIGSSFDMVTINNNINGFISHNSLKDLDNYYIEVDISDQKVYIVDNDRIIFVADVVTGNPNVGNTPGTNTGYQEILEKTYNRPLIGDTWNVDVNYFFPFNLDGEGFHDASWRGEFGGNIYTYNGSHGCINMRYEDVNAMDKLIDVGTKVLIHK